MDTVKTYFNIYCMDILWNLFNEFSFKPFYNEFVPRIDLIDSLDLREMESVWQPVSEACAQDRFCDSPVIEHN